MDAPSRVVPNRKPDLVLCTKLRKTRPALLIHPRRSGKCHCYASSSSYHDSRSALFFKKMSGPYIGRSQKPDIAKTSRTRAYYKSEEYDISEIRLEALTTPETSGEVVSAEDSTREELLPWWQDFPKRWAIVLLCFMAFLLCNMDRVNMSIAILPMSQEFGWNSATVGLIQSSFFWGYLLTQIVGGIWADKIGGKLVLGFGVVWWSIATVLTPIAARLGLPFLLIMRAFMGIGEGVAMPAMNNIFSKWIPVSERSRCIWFTLWQQKARSSPKEDPELSFEVQSHRIGSALCLAMVDNGCFCQHWWLDCRHLVSRGLSVTSVKKIMRSIGFLGPAFFLTQLSNVKTPALAVLCMACSQGSDAFSQSGLYSNHQDIGPRYAGSLVLLRQDTYFSEALGTMCSRWQLPYIL
ncbi:hypothetical protein MLD38_027863 [Melastoma candidum]|uniref:Uncharacterized protein n=1 Tax=Melastoma candidum TaxID=119954 RepID=A0ACB9N3H7_9MYRT|nr:hypothetical protein MLD38_027863 [Melastoma candidum]